MGNNRHPFNWRPTFRLRYELLLRWAGTALSASRQYSVMVRYGSNEGGKYVSALRMARGDDLVRGSRLNDVLVDFGQIGVCDRDAVERAFDILGDAGMPT